MYKSDIEIAQSVKMLPIGEIAEKAGIDDRFIEPYGRYKAKVDYNFLNETKGKDGRLILVTAINPTPAGEGKTTTTIGLADGLKRLGKRSARRPWSACVSPPSALCSASRAARRAEVTLRSCPWRT